MGPPQTISVCGRRRDAARDPLIRRRLHRRYEERAGRSARPSSVRRLRASFEERPQLPAARWVAQLAQRLGLYLPDALAGDREALADLLERVLAAVADPEPHLDHFLFARRERLEDRLGLLLEVQVDH